MPLAKIAKLIETQIVSMDAAVEAIQAASETLATESETIDTALGTLKDEVVTLDANVANAVNKLIEGCPITIGTPFTDFNATPVAAAATAQTIKAAPGAGIGIRINGVTFSNVTAAEVAILQLEDEDDNILAGPFSVGDPAVSGKGSHTIIFPQPIKLPANKALQVACIGDVGDSTALVYGYTESGL